MADEIETGHYDDDGNWVEDEQCSDPTKLAAQTAVCQPNSTLTGGSASDAPISKFAQHIAAQNDVTTSTLTQQQRDILATAKEIEAARNNGQRVMVIGAGAGCLAADTVINVNRAGKSLPMQLSRVVSQFSGEGFDITREYIMGGKVVKSTQKTKPWDLTIPTYVARADGEVIKLGRLVNAWYSGEKETYTVTTNTGRSIRATAIHPFLMEDGEWIKLEEMRVGYSLQINSGRSVGGRGAKIQYRSSDTKFHPYQVCKSVPRQRYGVPTHRLIVEAKNNNLTLREYLWILRCDCEKSAQLSFLPKEVMVHHKNGNTMDNDISNLEIVSGQKEHSNQHEWVNNVLWQVGFEEIVSIEPYGMEPTYDIEVEDDPHNFLANGFVVHNTGKTFTLKELEQVLTGIGQYTAFNRSLVDESKTKFKKASCKTSHGLAFGAVGRKYAHRLDSKRVKSYQIAQALGIDDYKIQGEPYPVGSHEYNDAVIAAGYTIDNPPPAGFVARPVKVLRAKYLAGQVSEAIKRFCQSADREITERTLKRVPGIDAEGSYENSDKVKAYLLPFARKMWADLTNTEGTLPFSHDVYVKIWQLGTGPDRPVIAADYILLDEAQDTAPVMLDVLKQQKHAILILVGDDNQQIYEWRGAVNAMASFAGAPRRLLSQSFRFGQTVADVANSVLALLDEPTDLVMRGLESIPTRICAVANPRCYLYRTNAGAIGRLMSAREAGKRGHLIGKVDEVVKFCEAANDLQHGRATTHPELGCFSTWKEVQEYSKEDEGADLRLMVKLIDEFGATEIIDALKDMPSEEDADLILSTAHRSKGREWSSVRLGADFPLPNKMEDSDRRLLYVAVTRAQEELDISECPTFMGGWDKKGGGEDGEKGVEWIPGIEITFTVPMPTEAELATYRTGKVAAEIVKKVAVSQQVRTIPTTAPQANGNGASGDFTWANMDGGWCVRGPQGAANKRVTVTKKNGDRAQVALGEAVKNIGDKWFYKVK